MRSTLRELGITGLVCVSSSGQSASRGSQQSSQD